MITREVYDKIREALSKDLSQYGLAGVFRTVAVPIPGYVPRVDEDSNLEEIVFTLVCLSYWKAYIAQKYLAKKVDPGKFATIMNALKILEDMLIRDKVFEKIV